ncbi:MAG: ZIP family metal transporter [Bacillota bacterium]
MQIWIYTIISIVIVSASSLTAVFFLSMGEQKLHRMLHFLVSFAVGALFGDAMIHLLPESFERISDRLSASLLALAGIIIFFILEKFIRWRHCHNPDCREHSGALVMMNLVGDGVHNMIDGMIIAASFMAGTGVGITTTLAVVLHEIPQEIGDFGVLVHGGLKPKRALILNFLSALLAMIGGVLALAFGQRLQGSYTLLLPVTAGGFIYIAGSDLLPEIKHEGNILRSLGQLASIALGILIMAALTLFEI